MVTFRERACGMTSSAKIPMIPPVRCNCARIRRAARNVTRFYDACLAPVGITASRFTLVGYLKHQGPIRMGQLAELLAMDMDRATLGHNLRPLERDGLWKSYPTKKIAELGWRQSLRPGSIASSKGARSGINRNTHSSALSALRKRPRCAG